MLGCQNKIAKIQDLTVQLSTCWRREAVSTSQNGCTNLQEGNNMGWLTQQLHVPVELHHLAILHSSPRCEAEKQIV